MFLVNAVDDCLCTPISSLIVSFRIHSSLQVLAARIKASISVASNFLFTRSFILHVALVYRVAFVTVRRGIDSIKASLAVVIVNFIPRLFLQNRVMCS